MSPVIRAAFWMSGAIVSFSLMAIAGRAVALDLDTFEIMMYRSIVGVAIVSAVAATTGHLGDIKFRRLGLHSVRNISHFAGQNLWFYAITVSPLAMVFALEFTSPLWAMFLAVFILGEKLNLVKILSALIGFSGILIIARPFGGEIEFGLIMAALSAIGFAGSAVFTRLLTRTENITSILFFLTLMQFLLGIAFSGFDGDIALPTASNLPWLVLIALCGLVAHFCLTTALSIAPAATVMPIDFIRLPVIAFIGMMFYAEALDPWVFLGAIIIFGANYFNIWHAARR